MTISISAAAVAGICVGAVVFGLLAGASIFWALLRRARVPVGTLFEKPGLEALSRRFGEDQAALMRLRDTFENLSGNPSSQLHHSQHVLVALHRKVQNWVKSYLGGDGPRVTTPEQLALFDSLAGPQEDWRHLHEFDLERRQSSLVHFILRTLHRRMIPDGDLSITLLPVDILSTYQRILTKNPPVRPSELWLRKKTISVQYWRALTTYWCTETFSHVRNRGLTRPNLMKMQSGEVEVCNPDGMHMANDDPRMPHVIETEECLRQALAPFFQTLPSLSEYFGSDLQAERPRGDLRMILELAADIGIMAFSAPEPHELYWPPSNRRPGCDPSTNDGLLECFGVRTRVPVPAMEYENFFPVKTVINMPPFYNDSIKFFGTAAYESLWSWYERECQKAPNGDPGQAIRDEYKKRERGLEEYAEAVGERDYLGWNGGIFF